MSFLKMANWSWVTGGVVGPTLPCQRTDANPDLWVRVVRADTGATIDGVEVRAGAGLVQNSGTAGAGTAYFPTPGQGQYAVRVVLLTPAQNALYVPPAARNVVVSRRRRCAVVVPVQVIPLLVLTYCDHHIAPSREVATFRYTIRGLSHREVRLRVSSPQYAGNGSNVFERVLTAQEKADGDHTITWNGQANRGRPLRDRWVSPLLSPYDVRLVCPEAPGGGTVTLQLRVYYHSIRIHEGTFTPDGQAPNQGAHPIAWAQYRLNQLGYLSGPVDDVKGPQTQRALRRYAYESPGSYPTPLALDSIVVTGNNQARLTRAAGLPNVQVGDVFHVQAGPNVGTDWQVYSVGGGGTTATVGGSVLAIADAGPAIAATVDLKETDDETHPALVAHLTAGDFPRLLFEGDALPAEGQRVKAYVSHDYFYKTTPEFLDPIGHLRQDQEKLDPFEVSVLLVGRDDPDGTAPGVAVDPQAVGLVEIAWLVDDQAEDVTVLPPLAPTAAIPSRGRIYMNLTLAALRDPATGADNGPVANNGGGVGGGRRPAATDHGAYFAIGAQHAPWTTAHVGTSVYSTVHQDETQHAAKLGRAGAWFRGSYLAGDDFRIRAQLAFARHGANPNLAAEHAALANLTGRAASTITDASTGTFTIWRTHHIAAVVNWPAPTTMRGLLARAVPTATVAEQYAAAHCELVTNHVELGVPDLFPGAGDRADYLARLDAQYLAGPFVGPGANAQFREGGIFPFSLPPQGAMSAVNYDALLGNAILPFTMQAGILDMIGAILFQKVRARRRAGTILFRFDWHAPILIRSQIRRVGGVVDFFWARYFNTMNACFGAMCGVAFLENPMTALEGPYLFAHEMAHCRFLQHDETAGAGSDNPADHDTNDHNCVMSYPNGIASRNPVPNTLHWTTDGAEQPRFCGKCVLKLRGWNPTQAPLPVQS